jgi:hypothetical protein
VLAITGKSPWLRWSVIATVALVALLHAANLTGYPTLTRDPQFPVYIVILALVIACYLAIILWWTGLSRLASALRWGDALRAGRWPRLGT